ncbi:hypothetical protein BO94DRAFT_591570 [Aspergillus sclerotioniger CBS 115572]|uniref:Uncharacterized protein n=1 Tax=Aspergillus sclerotioniger CBS 115572 TaxID=1450535 RepID=A0A317URJ0_9EURO|nr:hypothetical protein BO94DRAFT_591570 [Aspergillus sclerotioniger CBS 115572]PWY63698.1 hypothetical protein BO94DRAFT_591570 [Aspergillus sclerotioniger CBS 115572]
MTVGDKPCGVPHALPTYPLPSPAPPPEHHPRTPGAPASTLPPPTREWHPGRLPPRRRAPPLPVFSRGASHDSISPSQLANPLCQHAPLRGPWTPAPTLTRNRGAPGTCLAPAVSAGRPAALALQVLRTHVACHRACKRSGVRK